MTRRSIAWAVAVVVVGGTIAAASTGAAAARANTQIVCPGGKVRFSVEPYDTGPKFLGAYKTLTTLMKKKLGCSVSLYIAQNYTAEVEAMRAKKIDVAEFGPLGYIFAAKLAKAKPVAVFGTKDRKPVTYTAALWVPTGSTIQSVTGLKGHTVAFSD